MITAVAHVGRRQCRPAAGRRFSRTRMAPSHDWLCQAILQHPSGTVRHRSTGHGTARGYLGSRPAPLSATSAVMLTACADFADLFEVKDGGSRLAAAPAAAVDSALTFTACGGELRHGPLVRSDGNPQAVHRAFSWGAAVPSRGRWLITVEAVPAHDGSPVTLHHPLCRPVEHARAASGVPRGDGGPAHTANTPPGHGQPRAGS